MADVAGYQCAVCGNQNPPEEKYCGTCGHWLPDPDFPAEPARRGGEKKTAAPKGGGALLSVLAVEVDGPVLRAAVVTRGLRGVGMGQSFKMDRAGPGELITPEEAAALIARVEKCPKNVVLVSPAVTMVEIFMDIKRIKKMRPHQIKEAVRWEAEPYMTVDASESLVGYQIGAEVGDDQTGIWVSMLPAEDYLAVKRIFADLGLRLKRIYPPDVCFPLGAAPNRREKRMAMLDVGSQTMKLALVEKGRINAMRSLPLGLAAAGEHMGGAPSPELEPSLVRIFAEAGAGDGRVLVTGAGGLDRGFIDFLNNVLRLSAEPLPPCPGCDVMPEFAAVMGAGRRELYLAGGWRFAGVDDEVDPVKRLRERIHIFPIVTVAAMVVLFLGHYLILNYQMTRAEANRAELERQRDELQAAVERYAALQGESKDLERAKQLAKDHVYLLREGARERLGELETYLGALLRFKPRDMTMAQIYPLDTAGKWHVSGTCANVMSVTYLALNMQSEEWCNYVRVISITRAGAREGDQAASPGKAVYDFQLEMEIAPRVAPPTDNQQRNGTP